MQSVESRDRSVIAGTARLAVLALWCGVAPAATPAQAPPAPQPSAGKNANAPGAAPGASDVPAVSGNVAPKTPDKQKIFVIPINDGSKDTGGMIDPWQANFVRRKVEEALKQGATKIVLDINTWGGRVDASMEIGNAMDSTGPDVETIAYVSNVAWSGGAYVALTCDRIYMKTGTSMGSAAIVAQSSDGETKALGEKYTSAMRAQFRTRAESKERHRPFWPLWYAMVDNQQEVWRITYTDRDSKKVSRILTGKGRTNLKSSGERLRNMREELLVEKGELLNVTDKQAEEWGMIDGRPIDLEELLSTLANGQEYESVIIVPTWSDDMARFFAGPVLSGLLILFALLGLVLEVKGMGNGLGAVVFALCLGMFFWCKFIAGSATGLEIILFLVGMACLGIELFALPGFGVFGFGGVAMILGSLVLSSIPEGYISPEIPALLPQRMEVINQAFLSVLVSTAVAIVSVMVLARYMHMLPVLDRFVLTAKVDGTVQAPEQQAAARDLVGRAGVAVTTLRPAGKAEIDGVQYDVVSQSGFIEPGRSVRVLEVSGNRIVVEPV